MKSIIIALSLCAAAICAPPATKKKSTTPPPPPALTIPKDAVPNPDGKSFSYTDKEGKKWTYTKTPFGISKVAAVDAQPAAPPPPPDTSSTKAIDKGDLVRFERPGPFGTTAWEKKKSELTDDERRIFDAQNVKPEQQ
jgi:hypothetical protein